MEGKKISFGFKKTKKTEKPVNEEEKDFIECVEEKAIKVIGGEEVKDLKPLVIPMKANTLVTAERLKQIAEQVENSIVDAEKNEKCDTEIEKPPENETLEQMAVRELMQGAKKEVDVKTQSLTVPVPNKNVVEGQKESTLDDYESVPIQEFGMAMLRGMGWKPGSEQSKYKHPELRPKGLGLGADKVVKENQKKKSTKDKDEELSIVKNSFVKITMGKFSGYYGKVVSLDDDNGRVMVDITMKKETVSLSEFMMHAVTKSEYDRESKVINADKYEEYKKSEKSQNKNGSSKEREGSSSQKDTKDSRAKEEKIVKDDEKANGKGKERSQIQRRESSSSDDLSRRRYRRDSSSSDNRSRRKEKKRYSSNDSLSSDSDRPKRKKKSKKHYRRGSDSDKEKKKSSGKRDIDKKRKGKKKKRDRDRSPNYKKCRK